MSHERKFKNCVIPSKKRQVKYNLNINKNQNTRDKSAVLNIIF